MIHQEVPSVPRSFLLSYSRACHCRVKLLLCQIRVSKLEKDPPRYHTGYHEFRVVSHMGLIHSSQSPLAREIFSSRDLSIVLGNPSFARDLNLDRGSARHRIKNKQRINGRHLVLGDRDHGLRRRYKAPRSILYFNSASVPQARKCETAQKKLVIISLLTVKAHHDNI